MAVRTIAQVLAEHELLAGLDEATVEFVAGCGRNAHFAADEYLFRENDPANRFYVLRQGRVALEAHVPGRGTLVIDTVGPDALLGFSWLVPPYRWTWDGRAIEPVRAVQLDGACIRARCQEDPRLGFELMQRLVAVVQGRLRSARIRLLDLYGGDGAG